MSHKGGPGEASGLIASCGEHLASYRAPKMVKIAPESPMGPLKRSFATWARARSNSFAGCSADSDASPVELHEDEDEEIQPRSDTEDTE